MVPFSWTHMLQCCSCISEHLFYRTKDVCSQKPMHKCLISLFITVPNWKQLWCSPMRVKETAVHLPHGILHSSTRGWAIDIHKSLMLSEKGQSQKGYVLSDSIDVKFLNDKITGRENMLVVVGVGRMWVGVAFKRQLEGFSWWWLFCVFTVIVDTQSTQVLKWHRTK